MPGPLLSVVIPTRNRKEMALVALQSALDPLPFEVEIILSDNAGSDDTADIAALYPAVRYVRRNELLSQTDHFNLCVSEAKGKYVKILCDDDWVLPGALMREVEALEKEPAVTLAVSAYYEVDSTGLNRLAFRQYSSNDVQVPRERLLLSMLIFENVVGSPSNVTFRKSAFGGFPSNFSYAIDWAAWVQLADAGSFAFLAEPGACFRLHPTNLTLKHVESGNDFLEVQALRKECLRRLPVLLRALMLPVFLWIWTYRFSRRLAKFARQKRWNDIGVFVGRVLSYIPPKLPLVSER